MVTGDEGEQHQFKQLIEQTQQIIQLLANAHNSNITTERTSLGQVRSVTAFRPFNVKCEQWHIYKEQLEHHFSAHEVSEERKKDLLLSWVGCEMYQLITRLCWTVNGQLCLRDYWTVMLMFTTFCKAGAYRSCPFSIKPM
ncbi:hypothetical protein GJ496_009906 [Pomphorhynchus laevis]|nr:hypothetical protein GJ496_009906 [Pomphorhynchus laevis]